MKAAHEARSMFLSATRQIGGYLAIVSSLFETDF